MRGRPEAGELIGSSKFFLRYFLLPSRRHELIHGQYQPMQLNMIVLAALPTWIPPLWLIAAGAAIAVVLLLAIRTVLNLVLPKLGAIAATTAKEVMAQPMFWVTIAVGVCALVAFPFIPYNTFGEDVKVVKDSGLTVIMVLAIVLGVWSASVSIADEIEGRTALTLLSKPIARWHFIVGKFFGIVGPLAMLFVVLGSLFLASVSYKHWYDARENSIPRPSAAECQAEVVQIAPGLGLAFLEAVVMTSIAVAIATRLPMLANLMICSAIYVLGHLVALLAESPVGQSGMGRAMVQFTGLLIGTILPNLDSFNIYAAITAGREVPWVYLAWAGLYCGLYSAAAILVGLVLFHDRDLA